MIYPYFVDMEAGSNPILLTNVSKGWTNWIVCKKLTGCHHVISSGPDYCTALQGTPARLKGHLDNARKTFRAISDTHHRWPCLTFSATVKT